LEGLDVSLVNEHAAVGGWVSLTRTLNVQLSVDAAVQVTVVGRTGRTIPKRACM
jgi:hypothetical protein